MEWLAVGLCLANLVWSFHLSCSRLPMSEDHQERLRQLIKRDIEEQEYFMKTKAQKIAAALDVGTCTYFEKKELGL
jgi:hypothetical protein